MSILTKKIVLLRTENRQKSTLVKYLFIKINNSVEKSNQKK